MKRQTLPQTRRVPTFRTASGLGGTFTVSIVEPVGSEKALVRVHYATKDWDGHTFIIGLNKLIATGDYANIPA